VVGIKQDDRDGATRTVIGIDSIKEVLHKVSLKPYEGIFTVIIFDEAETMSIEAANALLKTLEEPPDQVLLLLLTSNEGSILTTVRSRCRRLNLRPVSKVQIEHHLESLDKESPSYSERVARLSRGCLGWAITAKRDPSILEDHEAQLDHLMEVCQGNLDQKFAYASEVATIFSRDRETARQLLYLWLRWWRDLLLLKEGAEDYLQYAHRLESLRSTASELSTPETVSVIKQLHETLASLDSNANPRLALEAFMMRLPRSHMKR
jgi:DNA polymerase-3 subunit delta'